MPSREPGPPQKVIDRRVGVDMALLELGIELPEDLYIHLSLDDLLNLIRYSLKGLDSQHWAYSAEGYKTVVRLAQLIHPELAKAIREGRTTWENKEAW